MPEIYEGNGYVGPYGIRLCPMTSVRIVSVRTKVHEDLRGFDFEGISELEGPNPVQACITIWIDEEQGYDLGLMSLEFKIISRARWNNPTLRDLNHGDQKPNVIFGDDVTKIIISAMRSVFSLKITIKMRKISGPIKFFSKIHLDFWKFDFKGFRQVHPIMDPRVSTTANNAIQAFESSDHSSLPALVSDSSDDEAEVGIIEINTEDSK